MIGTRWEGDGMLFDGRSIDDFLKQVLGVDDDLTEKCAPVGWHWEDPIRGERGSVKAAGMGAGAESEDARLAVRRGTWGCRRLVRDVPETWVEKQDRVRERVLGLRLEDGLDVQAGAGI